MTLTALSALAVVVLGVVILAGQGQARARADRDAAARHPVSRTTAQTGQVAPAEADSDRMSDLTVLGIGAACVLGLGGAIALAVLIGLHTDPGEAFGAVLALGVGGVAFSVAGGGLWSMNTTWAARVPAVAALIIGVVAVATGLVLFALLALFARSYG